MDSVPTGAPETRYKPCCTAWGPCGDHTSCTLMHRPPVGPRARVQYAATGPFGSAGDPMHPSPRTPPTPAWTGCLRDWERALRAANHPQNTRYNYLLAAAQLGRYLREYSPDPEAVTAAGDPTRVSRAHAG